MSEKAPGIKLKVLVKGQEEALWNTQTLTFCFYHKCKIWGFPEIWPSGWKSALQCRGWVRSGWTTKIPQDPIKICTQRKLERKEKKNLPNPQQTTYNLVASTVLPGHSWMERGWEQKFFSFANFVGSWQGWGNPVSSACWTHNTWVCLLQCQNTYHENENSLVVGIISKRPVHVAWNGGISPTRYVPYPISNHLSLKIC